jgi:hypothetical protein
MAAAVLFYVMDSVNFCVIYILVLFAISDQSVSCSWLLL